MLKKLTAVALALCLWSCGDEAEIEELKQYVKAVQQFHHYNVTVQIFIDKLGDPLAEKTQQDITAARELLDGYAAAVNTIADPDANTLRSTHELYLRSFKEAHRLAEDRTGDLKRQAQSVRIGFSKLRTDIRGRYYPSGEVLLGRKNLDTEEYKLKWPSKEK